MHGLGVTKKTFDEKKSREFHVKSESSSEERLRVTQFPSEAFYTLHAIPSK